MRFLARNFTFTQKKGKKGTSLLYGSLESDSLVKAVGTTPGGGGDLIMYPHFTWK